jgi:hypothetical protein
MRKRDLIDRIQSLNTTAASSFLSQFDERELHEYLDHLVSVQMRPHPNARAVSLDELPMARARTAPIAAAPAELLGGPDSCGIADPEPVPVGA